MKLSNDHGYHISCDYLNTLNSDDLIYGLAMTIHDIHSNIQSMRPPRSITITITEIESFLPLL